MLFVFSSFALFVLAGGFSLQPPTVPQQTSRCPSGSFIDCIIRQPSASQDGATGTSELTVGLDANDLRQDTTGLYMQTQSGKLIQSLPAHLIISPDEKLQYLGIGTRPLYDQHKANVDSNTYGGEYWVTEDGITSMFPGTAFNGEQTLACYKYTHTNFAAEMEKLNSLRPAGKTYLPLSNSAQQQFYIGVAQSGLSLKKKFLQVYVASHCNKVGTCSLNIQQYIETVYDEELDRSDFDQSIAFVAMETKEPSRGAAPEIPNWCTEVSLPTSGGAETPKKTGSGTPNTSGIGCSQAAGGTDHSCPLQH